MLQIPTPKTKRQVQEFIVTAVYSTFGYQCWGKSEASIHQHKGEHWASNLDWDWTKGMWGFKSSSDYGSSPSTSRCLKPFSSVCPGNKLYYKDGFNPNLGSTEMPCWHTLIRPWNHRMVHLFKSCHSERNKQANSYTHSTLRGWGLLRMNTKPLAVKCLCDPEPGTIPERPKDSLRNPPPLILLHSCLSTTGKYSFMTVLRWLWWSSGSTSRPNRQFQKIPMQYSKQIRATPLKTEPGTRVTRCNRLEINSGSLRRTSV